MENDKVLREDAVTQLAALRADRAALADRVVQPWWHDVASGLLLFGLLLSWLVDPSWLRALVTLAFGAGMAVLAWSYWRRVGVWVHPDRRQWLTWVPLALVVLVPAWIWADEQVWVMPVAGAVLGVALAFLSHRWSRQWAAELRGER